MADRARTPLGAARVHTARDKIRKSAEFLTWLEHQDRHQPRQFAGCSPDAAQTSRSTPTPSGSDCVISASHRPVPAPPRSASSPCKPGPGRRSHARYHDESLAIIAAEAAGPWSRYAPGDHTR
ncbi:hypothetical protein GCM10022214_01220 [Actinomadura miaoliensis]|uniref:Transposase n=1 Tax=Actinomadura miaoliensis TaxID=430685 RepID=A0ABP7UW16_9ACTN